MVIINITVILVGMTVKGIMSVIIINVIGTTISVDIIDSALIFIGTVVMIVMWDHIYIAVVDAVVTNKAIIMVSVRECVSGM